MTSLLLFSVTGIRTYASSDHRRSNPHCSSKPSSASATASANPNRCASIFGWSSKPDYIDGDNRSRAQISDPDLGQDGSRFTPGCFTEEKAKERRKKTMESANFHDIMYHSAIASRLASDLPDKPSHQLEEVGFGVGEGGCLWAALVLGLRVCGVRFVFWKT